MTAFLAEPIPEQAWKNAASSPSSGNGQAGESAAWDAAVARIEEMRHLGDDWDGLGAIRPAPELVDSAAAFARMIAQGALVPPSRVAPSTAGTIIFEWQLDNGAYGEVEIVRPFFAEVMWVPPGQPAEHWTLPNA